MEKQIQILADHFDSLTPCHVDTLFAAGRISAAQIEEYKASQASDDTEA